MGGDVHVRFRERLEGRFLRATRRVCAFQHEDDAERFYRALPKRLKFGLEVAEDKTNRLSFSRHHPGKGKRFIFLGFEFFWDKDRKGLPRVKRRTAPKKLQGACRRIKEWIKGNRHLPKRQFVSRLNRRLTGHYNLYPSPTEIRRLRPPLAPRGGVATSRHSPRYDSSLRLATRREERARQTKFPLARGIPPIHVGFDRFGRGLRSGAGWAAAFVTRFVRRHWPGA